MSDPTTPEEAYRQAYREGHHRARKALRTGNKRALRVLIQETGCYLFEEDACTDEHGRSLCELCCGPEEES